MTDPKTPPNAPWGKRPRRGGLPIGVIVWLALLLAVGIGLWFLADLFPGHTLSAESRAHLLRLLVVLALVSSGLLVMRRIDFGAAARNIVLWLGVAAILAAGYTFRDDLRQAGLRVMAELVPGYVMPVGSNTMVLTMKADGHFHVIGGVNGTAVDFLIDTGASDIVLSPTDALRAGIDLTTLRFTQVYQTANGQGRGAPLTLAALTIGPIRLSDVRVSVNEAAMSSSLLGMAFLGRLASFEVQGRTMTIRWH